MIVALGGLALGRLDCEGELGGFQKGSYRNSL